MSKQGEFDNPHGTTRRRFLKDSAMLQPREPPSEPWR